VRGESAVDAQCLTGDERSVVGRKVRNRDGNLLGVTRASAQKHAHRGMARTFQRPELFGELTPREHFLLARRVRHPNRRYWAEILGFGGLPTQEEKEIVDALLGSLGLEEVADVEAATLPLGTARQVEVGRALATAPTVVLLDEPSSGLDEHETELLGAALRQTRADHGVALLLVEHDVEFVLGLSEFVYVLDFGQLRRDSKVQDAYLGRTVSS